MAEGVPVDNDIGLFFRSFATRDWDSFDTLPRVVAVTGSNGKSTTSALIHHVLAHAGRATQLAGNIGRGGVLDIEPAVDGEVVVLELSSYQTDLARALTPPDVAVFTNLSPDHLDRHGGMGGYFAAKRRLFAEGGPDRAVIGVDEAEGGVYLAGQLTEGPADDRVIRVSVERKLTGPGWQVFARKGFLSEYRKGGRQVGGAIDLRAVKGGLPGSHNHQNACCAYAVCRTLGGLAPRVIEAAFHDFKGLPHRSQLVGEADGVAWVNDSKATNVDAAAAALGGAFQNIRWIAGGLGKEGGIEDLTGQLGNVAKAYLIGHSARDFALQLGDVPYEICETMERAVARASEDAQTGGDTSCWPPRRRPRSISIRISRSGGAKTLPASYRRGSGRGGLAPPARAALPPQDIFGKMKGGADRRRRSSFGNISRICAPLCRDCRGG